MTLNTEFNMWYMTVALESMQVVSNKVLGDAANLVADSTIPKRFSELLGRGCSRRANRSLDESVPFSIASGKVLAPGDLNELVGRKRNRMRRLTCGATSRPLYTLRITHCSYQVFMLSITATRKNTLKNVHHGMHLRTRRQSLLQEERRKN